MNEKKCYAYSIGDENLGKFELVSEKELEEYTLEEALIMCYDLVLVITCRRKMIPQIRREAIQDAVKKWFPHLAEDKLMPVEAGRIMQALHLSGILTRIKGNYYMPGKHYSKIYDGKCFRILTEEQFKQSMKEVKGNV